MAAFLIGLVLVLLAIALVGVAAWLLLRSPPKEEDSEEKSEEKSEEDNGAPLRRALKSASRDLYRYDRSQDGDISRLREEIAANRAAAEANGEAAKRNAERIAAIQAQLAAGPSEDPEDTTAHRRPSGGGWPAAMSRAAPAPTPPGGAKVLGGPAAGTAQGNFVPVAALSPASLG